MSDIGISQNSDGNVRRMLAARKYYTNAKRSHVLGTSLTVLIAAMSPLALFLRPDLGPLLGAIAGGWIFASRLALAPIQRGFQLKGNRAQEAFDCSVLGLAWNRTLARRPSEEEIRSASGAMKNADRVRSWYATSSEARWPESVLLCQRSNAVWARRQHRVYAVVVLVATAVWGVFGIVLALIESALLSQYLTTIALPSLPALLDGVDIYRGHSQAAEKRQLLEDRINELLDEGGAASNDLREIQDQLYGLRSNNPLVPEWFYKLIKPGFEADMKYGVERSVDDLTKGRKPPRGTDNGTQR